MATSQPGETRSRALEGVFRRDLRARRVVTLELPEFLICALEARVAEANTDAGPEECATLDHYIESEPVNLVTLRDVAELEIHIPDFAEAVHQWVIEMRTASRTSVVSSTSSRRVAEGSRSFLGDAETRSC